MKSKAYSRYYDKNREELKAKMRERDAKKREERRAYLEEHPDEIEDEQRRNAVKYQNHKNKKMKEMIEALLENPIISEKTKVFLRDELLKAETYKKMTPANLKKMLDALVSHD